MQALVLAGALLATACPLLALSCEQVPTHNHGRCEMPSAPPVRWAATLERFCSALSRIDLSVLDPSDQAERNISLLTPLLAETYHCQIHKDLRDIAAALAQRQRRARAGVALKIRCMPSRYDDVQLCGGVENMLNVHFEYAFEAHGRAFERGEGFSHVHLDEGDPPRVYSTATWLPTLD